MLPHAPDGLFIATALPAPPGRGGGRRASASGLAPLSSMCAGARGRAEDDGRDRGLTHNRGFAFDRPVRSSYRVSNPNRERDGTSNEARGRTPRTPPRARRTDRASIDAYDNDFRNNVSIIVSPLS